MMPRGSRNCFGGSHVDDLEESESRDDDEWIVGDECVGHISGIYVNNYRVVSAVLLKTFLQSEGRLIV